MRLLVLVSLGLLGAALVTAACGGDGEGEGQPAAEPVAAPFRAAPNGAAEPESEAVEEEVAAAPPEPQADESLPTEAPPFKPGVSSSPSPPAASCVDLTGGGDIVARVTAPMGGGSPDIEVIRDGDRQAPGTSDPLWQYDTFWERANEAIADWIGIVYADVHVWERVVWQEGMHFHDGGWFDTLTVQVRQGGSWVPVTGLTITPAYPFRDNGLSFETFQLRFDPIAGDGVRLFGAPGGSADFISVGELSVFGDCS